MTDLKGPASGIRRIPAAVRKVGLALGALVATEIGARIVAPSIDSNALRDYFSRVGKNPLLTLYDVLAGGGLSRGAVLALGIAPYLMARIVMRLGRFVAPELDAMHDDAGGRARATIWTRGLTFALALIQSYGFATFVQGIPGVVESPGAGFVAQTMVVLTAGAMAIAAAAELIAAQRDTDDTATGENAQDPGITRREFVGALAVASFAQPLWPASEDVSIVEFTDDGRAIRTVKVPKIEKTEAQWRQQLSALAYHVTRERGTEPSFSHEYWDLRDRGIYRCICCNNALFHSNHKFYPGTGWPSFTKPIAERNVVHGKPSPGDIESEVTCRRCDAHLGDLFVERTTSTGLRYCIDGVALRFFKS